MKKWHILIVAAALLAAFGLRADDDHEVARRAVQRGEILPLSKILEIAERDYPGRVLEVDLEREGGRYLYEIEILLTDGHVVELTYDAATGRLLEVEVED
ncbi:MAG: PepSY domain-containing protein [Gammaproteobacteria bacterium]|nr:peptidase [Gammaproteobacteria bacterium]